MGDDLAALDKAMAQNEGTLGVADIDHLNLTAAINTIKSGE